MRSTFMGLETARRGLFTQQSALYTTGHNVSNANTPGYTRQRVNFNQTSAFPAVGMNSPITTAQIGTGVEGGAVERIREGFLDIQYRSENNKLGYYSSMSSSLSKMEEIMNEPSETGLQSTLDSFWKSLQDLTTQTENSGARDVVAANGQMVAETINYYYNSLKQVQKDIGAQVGVKAEEVNTLVKQINQLNEQIASVEPHGYLPNDLYDERDTLVDKLSSLINIKVTNVIPTNYGNVNSVAEGLYNIEIVSKDGTSLNPSVNLISVSKSSGNLGYNSLEVSYNEDASSPSYGLVTGVTVEGKDVKLSGELGGLVESFGYVNNDGAAAGSYPDMLNKLNKMAEAFANEFNYIHSQGYALGATSPSGLNFFEFEAGNAATTITVNQNIINNSDLVAAGKNSGASGDNENAQTLADISQKNFTDYAFYQQTGQMLPDGLNGSLETFYAGIIGSLGVESSTAAKNLNNATTLAASVDSNRQSVSAVSLDEEMTNMIKYQQAYNSSARMITVMDEILDKIINGMGTGGR